MPDWLFCRGGSRILERGFISLKVLEVRFADFIAFFLIIPWKWNNLVSLRPNYFIFIGYLKTGGREGFQANPLILFDLILNVPVNNLSVTSGRVFLGWTSTKLGLICLAQGHKAMMIVKLEPAALGSWVKHSTTEPLRSLEPPWTPSGSTTDIDAMVTNCIGTNQFYQNVIIFTILQIF